MLPWLTCTRSVEPPGFVKPTVTEETVIDSALAVEPVAEDWFRFKPMPATVPFDESVGNVPAAQIALLPPIVQFATAPPTVVLGEM